ncbi:MAG: hypothetical protein QW594_00280, partial [Candidatus Woesearchaeota archaeon]
IKNNNNINLYKIINIFKYKKFKNKNQIIILLKKINNNIIFYFLIIKNYKNIIKKFIIFRK